MSTYGRVYTSAAEAVLREAIFQASLNTITLHNQLFTAGLVSYFLKVNQYADMTFSEFSAAYLGLGQFNTSNTSAPPTNSVSDLIKIF